MAMDPRQLFKTEMCRSFVQTGLCSYGPKCQFAHGPNELRNRMRSSNYKTQRCKTFWMTRTCTYGARCNFLHDQLQFPESSSATDGFDEALANDSVEFFQGWHTGVGMQLPNQHQLDLGSEMNGPGSFHTQSLLDALHTVGEQVPRPSTEKGASSFPGDAALPASLIPHRMPIGRGRGHGAGTRTEGAALNGSAMHTASVGGNGPGPLLGAGQLLGQGGSGRSLGEAGIGIQPARAGINSNGSLGPPRSNVSSMRSISGSGRMLLPHAAGQGNHFESERGAAGLGAKGYSFRSLDTTTLSYDGWDGSSATGGSGRSLIPPPGRTASGRSLGSPSMDRPLHGPMGAQPPLPPYWAAPQAQAGPHMSMQPHGAHPDPHAYRPGYAPGYAPGYPVPHMELDEHGHGNPGGPRYSNYSIGGDIEQARSLAMEREVEWHRAQRGGGGAYTGPQHGLPWQGAMQTAAGHMQPMGFMPMGGEQWGGLDQARYGPCHYDGAQPPLPSPYEVPGPVSRGLSRGASAENSIIDASAVAAHEATLAQTVVGAVREAMAAALLTDGAGHGHGSHGQVHVHYNEGRGKFGEDAVHDELDGTRPTARVYVQPSTTAPTSLALDSGLEPVRKGSNKLAFLPTSLFGLATLVAPPARRQEREGERDRRNSGSSHASQSSASPSVGGWAAHEAIRGMLDDKEGDGASKMVTGIPSHSQARVGLLGLGLRAVGSPPL